MKKAFVIVYDSDDDDDALLVVSGPLASPSIPVSPQTKRLPTMEVDCLAAKRSRNLSLSLDKPLSFGRSTFNLVFTSLANAIEIWEASGEPKSRHLLPKFNIVASVVKWGVPKQTKGTIAVSF